MPASQGLLIIFVFKNSILLIHLKIEEGVLSQLLFLSVEFTGKIELERAKYS